ncbi:septum formation inhibitor MinC [Asticcacaulis sp. EMRT-3]|uniref:cell division protein FtsL n=1 Tax=Asticcacaulis sp. EMRT-3 TaxID=3040349 RepID=UPI0024AEBB42|nr:septum formation inhibitor MinC [Asticcacaulis sp. EMRT-3]MDI7773753.1 septum formation inhibitor MinC [Asticcacaulis sp. EMRT-3]
MRIFEQRIRGFRLIELVGVALLLVMFFWVFMSKVREGDDIRRLNDLDDQISAQQAAVNALRINVAQLERPQRLEDLAVTYLGMKPVAPSHETDLNAISQISQTTSRPAPVYATPPAPPATAPAADMTLDGNRALPISDDGSQDGSQDGAKDGAKDGARP